MTPVAPVAAQRVETFQEATGGLVGTTPRPGPSKMYGRWPRDLVTLVLDIDKADVGQIGVTYKTWANRDSPEQRLAHHGLCNQRLTAFGKQSDLSA